MYRNIDAYDVDVKMILLTDDELSDYRPVPKTSP